MIVLYVGILSGFLTIFINYCIGKPGSKEFSPYEIFSFYTVWLSKRRLKQVELYDQYSEQYEENLERGVDLGFNHNNNKKKKYEVINIKNDFKKMLYEAADPFFTWERAAGMCPVCNGFWLSGLIATFFTLNVVNLVSIILISHITIRILNKIL